MTDELPRRVGRRAFAGALVGATVAASFRAVAADGKDVEGSREAPGIHLAVFRHYLPKLSRAAEDGERLFLAVVANDTLRDPDPGVVSAMREPWPNSDPHSKLAAFEREWIDAHPAGDDVAENTGVMFVVRSLRRRSRREATVVGEMWTNVAGAGDYGSMERYQHRVLWSGMYWVVVSERYLTGAG